jgi:hypothetical protein
VGASLIKSFLVLGPHYNNVMWNFSTFVTLGVVAITNVSSSNLIIDQSKSTMIPMNMWFVATLM